MSLPVEGHNDNAENSINNVFNTKDFLTKHKLLNVLDVFKSRDVTIEELMEFDDDDLEHFGTRDLKLDTLQKIRFIKAIQSLRKPSISSVSIPSTTTTSTNRPKQLTISTEEEKALRSLNNTFDTVNKLINDLNISSFTEVKSTSNLTNIEIENVINHLIQKILSQKNKLLNDIDTISQNKEKILKNQLFSLQKYLPTVKNAQNKYHLYINDTLNYSDVTNRKKLILEMADNILNHSDAVSSFILTKPSLKFISDKYQQKLTQLFAQNIFYVNDCDTPKMMQILKIGKVSFHQIQIKFKLNEFDANKNIANNVEEIGVEWTKIGKVIQKKKKKPKKKKKKKKKYSDDSTTDSDLSTESDSSSQSNTDSDSDSDTDTDSLDESDDEKKQQYAMNEAKEYEWTQNDEPIKYKYKSNKSQSQTGKYIITDLKDGYCYALRVRGRNKSGWGTYSLVGFVETKKKYVDYFYLFSAGHYRTSKKGKTLQSLNGDCNGQLIYGKLGIESGIYKWYVKKISGIGCYHSVGIKTFRDKSAIYSNRRIQNGEGNTYYYDGLNSGWQNGATMKIKLDCNAWKVSFYMDYGSNASFGGMGRGRGRRRRGRRKYKRKPNNYNYGASGSGKFKLIKCEKVMKRKKYYFAMELCNANGNHFQMIDEKEFKT